MVTQLLKVICALVSLCKRSLFNSRLGHAFSCVELFYFIQPTQSDVMRMDSRKRRTEWCSGNILVSNYVSIGGL
jgi:hypothetical protein